MKLADAARELGRPQAAREIARDLLELAGIARRPGAAGVVASERGGERLQPRGAGERTKLEAAHV